MLYLGFLFGTTKVSQLINRPVMSRFDTRMNGTSTEMVSHRIQMKLPGTTNRYRVLSNDLSQPTHQFKEEDTLGVFIMNQESES